MTLDERIEQEVLNGTHMCGPNCRTCRLFDIIDELKRERDNAVKTGLRLLESRYCNEHQVELQQESPAEFVASEDRRGCVRCMEAERERDLEAMRGAKVILEGIVIAFSHKIGESHKTIREMVGRLEDRLKVR